LIAYPVGTMTGFTLAYHPQFHRVAARCHCERASASVAIYSFIEKEIATGFALAMTKKNIEPGMLSSRASVSESGDLSPHLRLPQAQLHRTACGAVQVSPSHIVPVGE